MSPLAVAQYIQPGALTFDLCIIDEASQMPPEDALGGIVRSKQAVVVGDTKQLPPTGFFRKLLDYEGDGEDEEEDLQVLDESVLERANSVFRPARRLRWHYRSQHSGLISFSNHFMYNGDLVLFPSATENMVGRGVSYVQVEGNYATGLNTEEAKLVSRAAIEFMHNDPDRSLGIVALNQKQAEFIRQELEFALQFDSKAAEYVALWDEHKEDLSDSL